MELTARSSLLALAALLPFFAQAMPVLELEPGELGFELIAGQSGSDALVVGNSGSSVLEWALGQAQSTGRGGPLSGDWYEGFEDISNLPGDGWALINNSEPLGVTNWFQGSGTIFEAHEGPVNSLLTAAYHNTGATGTISNWLITPEVLLTNGTRLSFWTRTTINPCCADRLELRFSTAGDSVDVGASAESVGVFDQRLLVINENLVRTGYPQEWTQFVAVVDGLSEPVSGRFALRYYVTDGGIDGAHSNWIGVDTLEVTQPCATMEDIPWLEGLPTSGSVAPGDNDTVSVLVDSEGLAAGEYHSLLCVTSNDPGAGLVPVPVSLSVADPEPVIHLDATRFDFDLYAGQSDGATLTVTNLGNVDLSWNLTVDNRGDRDSVSEVLLAEDFAGHFPPSGWTVHDVGAQSCPWLTSDDYGLSGSPHASRAAAVDSDACLPGNAPANSVDARLVAPALDLAAYNGAELNFDLAYRHLGSSSLSVDVSVDGGNSWNTQLSWTSSTPANAMLPVTVDLSAFDGEPDVQLRWRYRSGWDWWAVIDNVTVTAEQAFDCHEPMAEPWLAVSPDAGVIEPGATQPLALTVDRQDLEIGTYLTGLCIDSNALDRPRRTVPVRLNVLPEPHPELTFVPPTFDFGNVEVGASTAPVVVLLTNSGTAAATGIEFGTVDSGFTVDASDCGSGPVLEVGQSCEVIVAFTSTTTGPAAATLGVSGDQDAAAELELTANGFTQPVIDVQPGMLQFDLNVGDTDVQSLTIANAGTGELNWQIHSTAVEAVAMPAGGPITEDWSEGFNDISLLPGAGWVMTNRSEPAGNGDWAHGSIFLSPHQGPPGSFIAAGTHSTTGGEGVISNWLLTPEMALVNGTELSFWTRTVPDSDYPDRLEVRLSTAAGSTDVGETAWSVGQFDRLLLSINEDLEVHGYPGYWTQYTVTISNLESPISGRIGFRYFVTEAGPSGINSYYIGIDTVQVTQPGACATPSEIEWLSVDPAAGSTAPGDVSVAVVTVDASALEPGDYATQLCVTSDDPSTGLVSVPVEVNVSPPPAPVLQFSVAALDFGPVELGTSSKPLVASLSNTGNASATGLNLIPPGSGFEVDLEGCGSILAAGADCPVTVVFTPTEPGVLTRILAIESDQGASSTLQVRAEAVRPPVGVLQAEPAALNFGPVMLSTGITASVELTHHAAPQAIALELSAIGLADPAVGFELIGGNCTPGLQVEAGESCQLQLRFSPVDLDEATTDLVIQSEDGQQLLVPLAGSGLPTVNDLFGDRFEQN